MWIIVIIERIVGGRSKSGTAEICTKRRASSPQKSARNEEQIHRRNLRETKSKSTQKSARNEGTKDQTKGHTRRHKGPNKGPQKKRHKGQDKVMIVDTYKPQQT
eukprot:724882_1